MPVLVFYLKPNSSYNNYPNYLLGKEPNEPAEKKPSVPGKAKLLDPPAGPPMLAAEFQHLLTPPAPAKCAAPRKPPLFVKKSALSSEGAAEPARALKAVKLAGSRKDDVKPQTVAKRPEEFPDQSLSVKGDTLWV